MAGKIIIDVERCKGCGLCVIVCPKNCIEISDKSNKKGYFPARVHPVRSKTLAPSERQGEKPPTPLTEETSNGASDCTGCAACAIIYNGRKIAFFLLLMTVFPLILLCVYCVYILIYKNKGKPKLIKEGA